MSKVKILIVEDDAIEATDLEVRLKKLGYSVCGTESYAEKSIEKIKELSPDLVLMDIALKGEMYGIDAAKIIRSHFDIPVVFLTAYADDERLERTQLCIPSGYLLKPFEDRDLQITIEMSLYIAKVNAERKQTEDLLREKEEKFRLLYERAPLGYQSLDEHGRFLEVNQAWLDSLGYTREEVIGKSFGDFLVPDWKDHFKENFPRFKAIGEILGVEFEMVKKDGSTILVAFNGKIGRDEKGAFKQTHCIMHDITMQKRSEKALQESEEKYRQLFTTVSDGIMIFDSETKRFVDINDAALSLYGYTREEFLKLTHADITAEPDKSIASIQQVLAGETTKIPLRYHKRKDGTVFPVEISSGTIKLGKRRMICGVVRDISDRKRSEEELKRLATAIEQAAESVIISDGPGTIHYVNPAFERLSGFALKDIVGQNFRILKSDQHDETFYRGMWAIISKGGIWSGRITNRMKDGSLREFETRISPVRNTSGQIINFVSVNRDVTHEVALEAQLQQLQKTQAIGTLAGGIAHDFNNILFPMIGFAEMMLDDIPAESPLRDNINEILQGAERAKNLVKQILTFSRQSDLELKPLKIQKVIKEALKLARSTLPSTIEIIQNINNDCGLVMADATQIHQIAMNVITNAYHAMQVTGGKLEVTLKEVELEFDDLQDPVLTPGAYVCLTISDTGMGMERTVLERIFDPYFTTKEKEKGTGLGLAVVHGLVKGHKGDVSVSSKPGKGTVFHIYLPVIRTRVEAKEPLAKTPARQGTERILLVDDEEQTVRMEKQMLERLGYHVTARTSSTEALMAFRAAPEKFDLVITDMTMPKMTGVKLSQNLFKIRSDMPIIICTGFSEQLNRDKAKALGISGFVMKPVVKSELAKKIREVLDRK